MNKADIINVLKQLDTSDDSQWTSDGAPRLDVLVKKFPGITRQLITASAPLFSRSNPALPDLEAMRAEAEKAQVDAENAAVEAKQAEVKARRAAAVVANVETPINDRHQLARANTNWYKAQIENDRLRSTRQDALDNLLSAAGGSDQVGQHPVERAIADKVVRERRNIVVNTKKSKEAQ